MATEEEVVVYTVTEAARALRLGPTFTRQLIARRELRAVRIGRRVVVPESAISEFIEAHSEGGPAPAPALPAPRRGRRR